MSGTVEEAEGEAGASFFRAVFGRVREGSTRGEVPVPLEAAVAQGEAEPEGSSSISAGTRADIREQSTRMAALPAVRVQAVERTDSTSTFQGER